MGSNSVFSMRFLYFMPEIDLLAVISNNDDVHWFSSKLQSFIDKCPGFITFMNDQANHRNAVSFAAGLIVLRDLLIDMGCKTMMLNVSQLEGAVKHRNTALRNELIVKMTAEIKQLSVKLNSIPRVEPVSKKISETLEIESDNESKRKKSILVVDDAVDCLNAVETLLEPWFDVYSLNVSGAYEDVLQRVLVDLFILDVEMPVMDGYQLLECLRKMPAYKSTPVVLLTSYATQSNIQLAKSTEVNGFVRKPFDGDLLVSKVCKIIADSPPRVYNIKGK